MQRASIFKKKVIILIEDHSGISFVCEMDKHVSVGPECVCKVKISQPSLHETQGKRPLFRLVMFLQTGPGVTTTLRV